MAIGLSLICARLKEGEDPIPGLTGTIVLEVRTLLMFLRNAMLMAQRIIVIMCRTSIVQAMAMIMDSAVLSCPSMIVEGTAVESWGVVWGVASVVFVVVVVVVMLQTWLSVSVQLFCWLGESAG